ncbi:MAG: AmmeMemoRadiSam system protein B [Desulfovibrionaceae bacterium]
MSMDRRPAWAGQFYPADPEELRRMVGGFLAAAGPRDAEPTILAMSPHAGYVYSGSVAGRTLGQANLASTILLLGPKHTPFGAPLALWDSGRWLYPGGAVAVDNVLAEVLRRAEPRLTPDQAGHAQEHSLEVMLPFLAALDPAVRVVPLAVGVGGAELLVEIGSRIGRALAAHPEPVSIVVSSDMSHQIPDAEARRLDAMALEAAVRLDPAALYATVRTRRITMCGVLPMTIGLAAARELGASKARVTAYATSGDVTGDRNRVVGYAGVIVS